MASSTLKCNRLTPLYVKGLIVLWPGYSSVAQPTGDRTQPETFGLGPGAETLGKNRKNVFIWRATGWTGSRKADWVTLPCLLTWRLDNSRVDVRAHSFPVRVISLWNRLPSHTQTILQFKTSLKSIDLSYALLGKKWIVIVIIVYF